MILPVLHTMELIVGLYGQLTQSAGPLTLILLFAQGGQISQPTLLFTFIKVH